MVRINALIEAAPEEAGHYLRRAELYARHGDGRLAEANFHRAEALAPDLPHLARGWGKFHLRSGRLAEAHRLLDRAVALDARDADARVLRARTQVQRGELELARTDYDAAIALLPEPSAEIFLERAGSWTDEVDALRTVEKALGQLGPVYTLQLRAIELETRLGRSAAALARIDGILAAAENKEPWLERRAQLVALASRTPTTDFLPVSTRPAPSGQFTAPALAP